MGQKFGGYYPVLGTANRQERWLFISAAVLALALVIILALVFQVKAVGDGGSVTGSASIAEAAVSQQPSSLGTVTLLVPDARVLPHTKLSDVKFREAYWPRNDVPPEAIRDRSELKDMFAKVLLQPHMPIVRSMLTNEAGDGSLPVTPGNRAVTIDVDESAVLEGFALAGSRVDVILTYADYQTQDVISKIIVQNARVLSIGGDATPAAHRVGRRPVSSARTVTLDVPPTDVLRIRTAEKMGSLSLSMRAMDDIKDSGTIDIDRGEIADGKKKPVEQRACSKGTIKTEDGLQFELGCDGNMRQITNTYEP